MKEHNSISTSARDEAKKGQTQVQSVEGKNINEKKKPLKETQQIVKPINAQFDQLAASLGASVAENQRKFEEKTAVKTTAKFKKL